MKINLNDYEKLHDQLVELLLQADIEDRPCDTQFYLKEDENGNQSIYTYHTVGNTYLDDDNAELIYTRQQDDEDCVDHLSYGCLGDLCYAIDLDIDTLYQMTADFYDCDITDVTDENCRDYIRANQELFEKCEAAYGEWLRDDFLDNYKRTATQILNDLCD